MAITQNYVDFGAGDDTTGDGSVGTPWKTLQHAFDTLTRNTTDGNQVNLKAGTAHVNSAALDLTTFIAGGALSATAPLILRGYTATANDGGMGEIDCGGATMFAATTYDYIVLVDLEIHTFGNNHGVYLDEYITIEHCTVHKGASSPSSKNMIYIDAYAAVIGCYVYGMGVAGRGIYTSSVGSYIYGNHINCGTDDSAGGITTGNATGTNISNNIVSCNHANSSGISLSGAGPQHIVGNICYNRAAGTEKGIHAGNFDGRFAGVVMNNIIVGWSGAGGAGIESEDDIYVLGHNAFYNNTANYDLVDQTFIDLTANDVALAADPFTDAANGDFSLTAAAKTALAAKGWPTAYLGAHANTVPNLNIGPIQMAASSGGGRPAFGDRSGGKF